MRYAEPSDREGKLPGLDGTESTQSSLQLLSAVLGDEAMHGVDAKTADEILAEAMRRVLDEDTSTHTPTSIVEDTRGEFTVHQNRSTSQILSLESPALRRTLAEMLTSGRIQGIASRNRLRAAHTALASLLLSQGSLKIPLSPVPDREHIVIDHPKSA